MSAHQTKFDQGWSVINRTKETAKDWLYTLAAISIYFILIALLP